MEVSECKQRSFNILHFNDVYNLAERETEPVGGAARFITAAETFKDKNPLVLFSGDIFSPSKLASIMKGRHMVPFFEHFKIDVSCVGNHDFDFGLERFVEMKNKGGFPWLFTNVFDKFKSTKDNKVQIAECLDHIILEHEGVKIGIIGLAESEWLESLACLEPGDFEYEDFVESAKRWNQKLRDEGCEIVIAMTHMRLPNDERLAKEVPELDIILGGHDHSSDEININGTLLLKSGTDFREFSIVEMIVGCDDETLDKEPETSIVSKEKRIITRRTKVEITKEFEPNESMQAVIEEFWIELRKKLEQVAGVSGCDMDARFNQIRVRETNVANFISDAVNFVNKTEVMIHNSGSFRTDDIIPEGLIKWKDVDTLFPIQDNVVILSVKGDILLKVLENGVSEVPKLEGKFPCVAGVRVKYDSSKPAFERIVEVEVNGEPLDKERYYRVTTKEFLYKGKDGYGAFSECDVLVDGENCLTINNALISFLKLMTLANNVWFNKKKEQVREALKLMNNHNKEHVGRDDEGKKLKYNFYKFYPKVDGRLTDINEAK